MKLQGSCRCECGENTLEVYAGAGTDYFSDPVSGSVKADAALVYQEITGDFVCRAKISLDHRSTFDGGALMAVQDDTHWVKACFERSEYGYSGVCTVVTDGYSDDCWGVPVDGASVWMQLARTGDVITVHRSLDGETWRLARLCRVKLAPTLRVGFEAQSPTGDGGVRRFTDYTIERRGLRDPRAGV